VIAAISKKFNLRIILLRYLQVDNISELERSYLYKFRKSKCLDTLDKQCELLELRNRENRQVLSAINYAWCLRELELKNCGAPVFKHTGMKNQITPF